MFNNHREKIPSDRVVSRAMYSDDSSRKVSKNRKTRTPIMNREDFVLEGMSSNINSAFENSVSNEMAMVPYNKTSSKKSDSPNEMAMVPYNKTSSKKSVSAKSPDEKEQPKVKKTAKCSTNRNGTPPCQDGFYEKLNSKGEKCCYKTKTTKATSPKVNKTAKCSTNRNGTPPCPDGFYEKLNSKGEKCCYKTRKQSKNST